MDQNYTLRRSKCEIPGLKGNTRNIVQVIHHPYWTSKTNTNPSVALTLSVSLSSGHGIAKWVPPRLVTWNFGYAPHPQKRFSNQIYSRIIRYTSVCIQSKTLICGCPNIPKMSIKPSHHYILIPNWWILRKASRQQNMFFPNQDSKTANPYKITWCGVFCSTYIARMAARHYILWLLQASQKLHAATLPIRQMSQAAVPEGVNV